MINSHRIIDQIAGFTALRDLELLEFSLLNTISGMLNPQTIKLVKVDSKNQPIKEIEYQNGKCNIHFDDIDLQADILSSIEYLNNSDIEEVSKKSGNNNISIHLLLYTRRTSSFLIILSKEAPSKQAEYLLSGIFQVYRNFSQLLQDSQTDTLTGLANRKTFDETISKVNEISLVGNDEFPDDKRDHSADEKPVFWLALVDIDHFKKVNDSYGHLYGDEVLVLFANLMKSCFREDDLLFRFGGEEFVVILKSPDKESCNIALERLRNTVEKTEFPGVGNITISIGAVRMSTDTFHITLLDYADQSLYYGKKHGRNQVNFFEELLLNGEVKVETPEAGDIELF